MPSPLDRPRETPDTFAGWTELTGMALSTALAFPWHPRVPARVRRWWPGVVVDVPTGVYCDLMVFARALVIGAASGAGGISGWTGRHGALLALLHLVHDHPLDTARLILVGGGPPAVRAYPWGVDSSRRVGALGA